MMSLPLMKIRSESEIDAMHGAKMRPLLSDFIVHAHFPFPHSFVANRVPAYWPSDVRYCDPNKEDIKFTNISRRPRKIISDFFSTFISEWERGRWGWGGGGRDNESLLAHCAKVLQLA